MLQLLKHFRERWNNWVGDRDMELAIRRHLTQNGFYGQTAKLRNVRLVAVQRPGWLQVFRFEAIVRVQAPEQDAENESEVPNAEPEYRELYGLVRCDARKDVHAVRVFEQEDQRRELFAIWSEDLICLRGAHSLAKREAS